MQKCRLNGEAVYAFKVFDEKQVYNYEYEKMLRIASREGNLKCEECGADITFKFGEHNKPYFAHKVDSLGGGCTYSKESNEHIEGKKLIMDLMRVHYPNIYSEFRYRFKEGKYADLYFKFNSGEELVIEFQRSIGVLEWNEKKEFYNKKKINSLWFVSGNVEDYINMPVLEYNLKFDRKIMLNENSDKLLVLDVQKRLILISTKIPFRRELFCKVYDFQNIKILHDGRIDCDFDKEANIEKEKAARIQKAREERLLAMKIEQEKRKKELEENQIIKEIKNDKISSKITPEMQKEIEKIRGINNNNKEKLNQISDIKERAKERHRQLMERKKRMLTNRKNASIT